MSDHAMNEAELISHYSVIRNRLRNPSHFISHSHSKSETAMSAAEIMRDVEIIQQIKSPGRVSKIQKLISETYRIGRMELLGHRRNKSSAFPRQIAMYLCTKLTILSLPTIGRLFDRDHTTILHARNKIERMRQTDAKLNAEIEALVEKLGTPE